MITPHTKYEEVILNDIQNPKYELHSRLFWKVYLLVGVALFAAYWFSFQSTIVRNFTIAYRVYQAACVGNNLFLKDLIFIYNSVFLFLIFALLGGVFTLVGFFALDMQRRNRLMRQLLEAGKDTLTQVHHSA